MASGKVPGFKTLKECLEFFQWLKHRKGVQGQIANRLMRLLDKKYESVNQQQIESALLSFLNSVSAFHTKLCKSPRKIYTGHVSAKYVLYALLDSVPKLLSALYFLRYQVDEKFEALGGGTWAGQNPGLGGKIDAYLLRKPPSNGNTIPGGFDRGELKMGYRYDYSQGYAQGAVMVRDLINILDKHSEKDHVQNFFIDVYSTTALSENSGSDTPNIANALRLVQDFCKIFENVGDKNDFENHLYSKDRCISLEELKKHCTKLKEPLGKLFNQNAFSFTGYAREYQKLKTQDIAKKMASWFKRHLNAVKDELNKIKPFDSKNLKVNMKHLKTGAVLRANDKAELEKYFTENFLRYGFTFYYHDYKVHSPPYDVLKRDWGSVIKMLNSNDDGLTKLQDILNGTSCQPVQPEDDEEVNEEPDDVELQDEDDAPAGTKTEAAKPVVTKAEAAKPTATKSEATKTDDAEPTANLGKKSEGAHNQGKKAEGAQNQGKKAEGAQNQGKKAEGPDQNNGQTEAKSPSLPVAQAVQPQTKSAPSQVSQLPGAPGTGNSQGSDGQADTSGAGQTSGQEAQPDSDGSNTGLSTGASGGGAEGGKKRDGDLPKKVTCEGEQVSLYDIGGRPACYPKPHNYTSNYHNSDWDDVWNTQQRGMLKDVDIILPTPPNKPKSYHSSNTPTLSSQSSLSALGYSPRRAGDSHGSGLDYYVPRGMGNRPNDQVIYNVNGIEVKDPFYEELEKVQRRNDAEEKRKALQWQVNQDKIFREVQRREEESIRNMQQHNDKLILRDLNDDIGEVVDPPRDIKLDIYSPHVMQCVENGPPKIQLFVDAAPTYDLGDSQMRPQSVIVDDLDIQVLHPSAGPTDNAEPIPGAQIGMDPVYDPPDFLISSPPKDNKTNIVPEDPFSAVSRSLSIEVPKRPFQDRLHDVELDDPDANRDNVLFDESQNVYLLHGGDKGFSALPKSNFDLELTPPLFKPDGNGTGLSHDLSDGVSASGYDGSTSKASGLGVREAGRVGEGNENSRHQVKTMVITPPEKICVQPTLENLWKFSGKDGIKFCDPIIKPPHSTPVFNRRHPEEIWNEHIQKEEEKQKMAEDQYEANGATITLDGSQPTDDVDAPQEPWWYSDPAYSEINGKTIDNDLQEQLKNEQEAENLYWETKTKILGDHIDQRNRLRDRQKQDALEIEKYRIHEENKVNQVLQNIQKETQENESIATGLDGDMFMHLEGKEIKDLDDQLITKFDGDVVNNDSDVASHQIIANIENAHYELSEKQRRQKEEDNNFLKNVSEYTSSVNQYGVENFDMIGAPSPKTTDYVDLQIEVPKRTLQDSIHDMDFDYAPPSPPSLEPLDPIGPSNPAINFTFPPVEDPLIPPPEDFDQKTIKQPELTMCVSSWATSTPTPGSTDIPETELFPAEAPRTVRDMLQWLAGLKHEKHHETLRQCINKAFGGPHSEPSQLALSINHTNILPQHVFDILQLTAMFASSVLSAIAPNWKRVVSSRTLKPNFSTQSDEPDCCALLCQLRDYVYACHHQLQFLKAQCKRNKSLGGWQDCKYGSDVTPTKSPLQLFLTDGWDSDFETHLFDPCNLCLKSRVRMGFRDEDLPSSQQTGATLAAILTPSCGGEGHDALLDTEW